jgi:hypothetical protein
VAKSFRVEKRDHGTQVKPRPVAETRVTRYRKGSRYGTELAKKKFLEVRRSERIGVPETLRRIGYSHGSYSYWRKTDPEFREAADRLTTKRAMARKMERTGERGVPDFPEFCERYLGMRLFWHQLQWFDLLEGREPRDIHIAQRYVVGADAHLLLVNTPPGHAKSTTITAAYTLWRLMKDPNTQAVIVSKNEVMAKKWMFQIQDWLTSNTYADLQDHFGPDGGFKDTCPVWTRTQIYFGSELRDKNAKDPTLEVLGMGGTIYGARADFIILDDCVDSTNAHDFERQIEWITGMVLTRPQDEDKVMVVGTRVAPRDLYRELMDPGRYEDEAPPWTYFAQPAVLEYADDPDEWVTLWPKSNIVKKGQAVIPDEDGLYPKWDGPSLNRMRKRLSTDPNAWPLKYQQQDVNDSMPFPREDVYGCVNGHRKVGVLAPGVVGVPASGMTNLFVIAGLDPASAGFTAAVVMALDRTTGKRYVLNVHNQPGMSPDAIRDLIKGWTTLYGVREWRIEKNAFQTFLTRDREVNQWLASRGVLLTEHHTGTNKLDADFGVGSMTGLFKGWKDRHNLIDLPNTQTAGVKDLCEQLCTWFPETKGKTDCVMALWFCEIRARELVDDLNGGGAYMNSFWLSESQANSQLMVDIAELERADSMRELASWWA